MAIFHIWSDTGRSRLKMLPFVASSCSIRISFDNKFPQSPLQRLYIRLLDTDANSDSIGSRRQTTAGRWFLLFVFLLLTITFTFFYLLSHSPPPPPTFFLFLLCFPLILETLLLLCSVCLFKLFWVMQYICGNYSTFRRAGIKVTSFRSKDETKY